MLQSYDEARKEEENKVEMIRRKNKHYEEWREKTKIVGDKERKEF